MHRARYHRNPAGAGEPIASAWGGEIHDALETLSAGGLIRMQFGQFTITGDGTPTKAQAFTFPIPFSAVPLIVIGHLITSTAAVFVTSTNTVTASGAQVTIGHRQNNAIASSYIVQWFAIGPA